MTTVPQRLINVVAVVVLPVPILVATTSLLEGAEYWLIAGLLAFIPILLLTVVNAVLYRKFTFWHGGDRDSASRRRQISLAVAPTIVVSIYCLSVLHFHWLDTKPLYLECTIKKATDPKDVGSAFLFGIKYMPPIGQSLAGDYFSFKGAGWKGNGMYLGIGIWDFESESWRDPLSPSEYHPNTTWINRRGGGLVVSEDAFYSQGWKENTEKQRICAELYGAAFACEDSAYEPFKRLSINRETGSFVMDGGYEGVCAQSTAPQFTNPPQKHQNTKF